MVRPSKKATAALIGIIAFIGVFVWGADTFVHQLPPAERATAWRWFAGGWAASMTALVLYFLPHWIRGAINDPDPDREEEMQGLARMMPWAAGAFGALSAGLGLATPSIAVGFMSLACGGLTALLIYGTALNTTKKGRAMLDNAKASE